MTIIFLSASSLALECEKVKCRYEQTSTREWLESDVIVKVHGDDSDFKKHSKSIESKNNRFCVTYVSSFTINQDDMNKMLECTIIDLSSNEIDGIERKLFVNHDQLETLNLNRNHLKELPENVFADLVNLRKLTLRRNYLEALDDDLFKFNVLLEHFDVSNNKLVKISAAMIDHLSGLTFISFHHNFCIDLAFPESSLDELKNVMKINCGEKNLVHFIVKLIKISTLVQKGAFDDPEDISVKTTSESSTES